MSNLGSFKKKNSFYIHNQQLLDKSNLFRVMIVQVQSDGEITETQFTQSEIN